MTSICTAINGRLLLELQYSGYSRLVEPYVLGRDSKGQLLLRCYQVSGGSVSGESEGWKLLKASEAHRVHSSDRGFAPRAAYHADDSAMQSVVCRV